MQPADEFSWNPLDVDWMLYDLFSGIHSILNWYAREFSYLGNNRIPYDYINILYQPVYGANEQTKVYSGCTIKYYECYPAFY